MSSTLLDESDLPKEFTESPLQQETAIPAPKRTRNNSIIPQQLLNDTGGGGRERAALATVFGVLEYSESKIFWERQPRANDMDTTQQELYYGHKSHATTADTRNDSTITTESSFCPPVSQSSSSPIPTQSSTSPLQQHQSTFTLLPDIPTVSRFNDILIEDENGSDLMFPANASSVLLHSSMRPVLDRSVSTTSIHSTLTTQSLMAGPNQMHTVNCLDNPDLSQQDQHQYQVSAPLLFIGYPPAVFDLLKPDDDDRIIIWGPDPKAVSASMATTTTASTSQAQESNSVPFKSKPSTLNSTADLPLSSTSSSPSTPPAPMRGFSSNTTTSVANLPSRLDHGRPRLLSGKLTDGLRKTLRSHSLMHRSSADNLKSILLLKRTFGNSKLKHQQHMNSISQSGSATTSFISPTQLCKLLILRFRWALENDEEDRRIVRIRTFVVMRHWLLNYFVHDFIPIRDLRVVLTTFLNALPSHPLVRSSPRDQRIVKGLKRVVRRLKKVYYHGTNSQRVQVIAPPPPSSDQERVEEMVRANLAHGLLRRKTALVRGVDVGGKHNGNMAVQDARRAPMVVIGNVHGNKTDFQVQNQQQQQQQPQVNDTALVTSDVSIVSSKNTTLMDTAVARAFILKENQNDQVTTAKQSYLQRMEVERKMNALSSSQDFHGSAAASQASVASDDSLESALSPGTTEIASDDDYYNDENDTGTLNSGDNCDDDDDTGSSIPHQQWKSEYQQSKLEHERRRREEEEERSRAEFFSVPETQTDNMVEIAGDGQPSLSDLYISDSRISLQRSLSSASEIITPTVSTNAIKNLDKTNGSNRQQQQQQQENQSSLNTTTENVEMTEEQAAVLASLERIDGPIRKAAIGDTSRIRRVPSSKWCQLSPDEESSASHQQSVPRMPSKGLTEDFIRKLDIADTISVDNMNDISKKVAPGSQSHSLDGRDSTMNHNGGAIGLSRHLSRKSIERRKSEKSLRDVAASDMAKLLRKSASTPSSPHHHHHNHSTADDSDIPDMPPLPDQMTNVPIDAGNGLLRHLRHKNSFTGPPAIEGQKSAFILPASMGHNDDDFEAIPYDQTVSPASMNESFAIQTPPGGHRRGLSKKFVNMVFSRSTSSPAGLSSNTEKTEVAPATPEPTTSVSSAVATPSSSAKVSTENNNFNTDNMATSLSTASTSTPATTSQQTNSVTPKKGEPVPVSPPPPSSTLVSRIAQELRESENDLEIQCDCIRCTGATTGPRACRRFSLALLTDDEKRQSMELRRRRGASIDKGNRKPTGHQVLEADNLLGETSNYSRPAIAQNGPMYLGQLNAAYSHSASDIGMHIEEIDEVDGDEKDGDSDSSSSSLSNSSTLSENIINSGHGRKYKQQEMTKRIKKHYLDVSNGSLDRLTGVSTKGDGTSLHRQAFSTTSIHSMDPSPHDLHDLAAHPQPSLSTETPAQATSDIPLPSSASTIPPWTPAHASQDMMDETTTTNGTTHYDQPGPMQYNPSSFILSYRSGKMAQQLCFIERDVLLGVDWEEMVHCRWTKMATNEATMCHSSNSQNGDIDDAHTYLSSSVGMDDQVNYTRQIRQMQLARQDGYGGIEQVIERFNTVCQWVASEIVSVQKLDLRVKVVEKFIRLAQKCRMYSNFATLVQILLGLQSPSVSRLKKTWARVGASEQRLLDELSQFTSPMRNWKHIRDNMTMVADEYGMSPTEVQVEMPGTSSSGNKGFKRTRVKIPFGGCIPFLGIYLSDLVFNSEQPPYLEPNHAHHKIYTEQTAATQSNLSPVLKQPLVNFRKHRITATVIKRVLTFQNLARRYAFDLDEEIYERCLLLDPLDAETVRRLSHAIE
ncbi:hypothetical protein BCR42DRAFT_411255 [Absidia repens]|uniref:Ras guanine nucleotide exchange factor domain-containing protein n=1 Tax=Absidia repens TaxID=90262 RepID=A0A1X2ILH0_9FUNG|nr:hypothetical protein BCR42DRAFT_411255 [Absidia repens]